jgi:glycosyltransferase involved in cell wall biosynthesis
LGLNLTIEKTTKNSHFEGKKALKLAFIQSFLPPKSHGGVGYFTHYFANEMVKRGHTVTIFSLHPPSAMALYRVNQLELPVRWQKNKLANVFLFSWLVARQDYRDFDLIHAQGDDFLLLPFVRKKPLVRTFSGSALAEAIHSQSWKNRLVQAVFYPLEWLSGGLAQARVGISKATCHHLPFVKTVIPQGVDLRAFAPSEVKSVQPTILFVGHKLTDRKRGSLLVELFKREILAVLPSAELWLVCEDKISHPNIKCFSHLSESALADLYRQAWVFCLPSSYEGFGRPYIEAMACGTPVVATPNLGAREVLANGQYGLVVDEGDLANSLLTLLQNPEKRAELSRAGLRRATEFSWQKIAEAYEAVYRQVLK